MVILHAYECRLNLLFLPRLCLEHATNPLKVIDGESSNCVIISLLCCQIRQVILQFWTSLHNSQQPEATLLEVTMESAHQEVNCLWVCQQICLCSWSCMVQQLEKMGSSNWQRSCAMEDVASFLPQQLSLLSGFQTFCNTSAHLARSLTREISYLAPSGTRNPATSGESDCVIPHEHDSLWRRKITKRHL